MIIIVTNNNNETTVPVSDFHLRLWTFIGIKSYDKLILDKD